MDFANMQLILLSLFYIWLISSLLQTSEGISEGCEDWKLYGSQEVCCLKCKPGNRMVTKCGPDPTKLCTPCQPGMYIIDRSLPYCQRCTQCTDPRVELEACTVTTNTKCGCKQGLRCGDDQCSFCVDECGKGHEPTDRRTCRKCPEETFNDQIHSACKPWTKRCPVGQILVAKGDAFSDIKCSSVLQPSTTVSPTSKINVEQVKKKTEDESTWLLVIGGICAFCAFFVSLLCFVHLRTKTKAKTKEPIAETFPQGEVTLMMVERDETCSYHQPEQEQGSSLESINTQDSDCKLIL